MSKMSNSEIKPEIDKSVSQERIKLLYDNLKYGEWLEWLGASAVAAIFWNQGYQNEATDWWGFMIVAGVILAVIRVTYRDLLSESEIVDRAGRVMSLALLLNGVGYGVAMWLFWSDADTLNNVLLSAVCAIAFMSYSHPLMAFLPAYILPATAVSIGLLSKLLYEYELLYFGLTGAYLSLAYLHVQGVFNSHRLLTKSIKYRFQLEQANEAANSAVKAKSAFFSNMSHELRTPMSGVIGVTQLLVDTELTGEQKKYIDLIKKSGVSLLSLIDEILDIAKIESGHMTLKDAPFNFKKLIDDVSEIFMVMSNKKGLDYSISFSDEVPECIVGDEKRVRQVLMNLLGNAVKFCNAGEVRLFVETTRETGVQRGLCICIEDTGEGMSSEESSKIFERFERIDESRADGTGLGLAISKLLIEEMKGDISVDSRVGVGTRFAVSLPLIKGDCTTSIEDIPTSRKISSQSVLVVDDDEINQLVVTRFLNGMGHDVIPAFTGREAMELLHAKSFDIVLMDIHMPDVGGVEVTQWIRSSSDVVVKDIPVVGMTASVMAEERDMYLSAGMNMVLGKPVDRDALNDAIASMLR